MVNNNSPQNWRAELRQALMEHFNESDIKSLCFDLNIDFEELSGENKTEKVISLIANCERTDTIPQLIKWCSEHRPNVPWDKIEAAAIQEGTSEKLNPIQRDPSPPQKPNANLWLITGVAVIIIILLSILVVNSVIESTESPVTPHDPTSEVQSSPEATIVKVDVTKIVTEAAISPTAPTNTPLTEQQANLGSGLKDGCIHSTVWTTYPQDSAYNDDENCWQFLGNGIVAKDDGLTIRVSQSDEANMNGIYSPFEDNVVIDFDIRLDQLQTSADDLLTNVTIGIVPSNLSVDSGHFIIYQMESSKSDYPVLMKHEERGDFDSYMTQEGEVIRYPIGNNDHVTMRIFGNVLNIFLNGQKVAGPMNLSFRDRVFWIGYKVPVGGAIEADISGLNIQE